MGILSPDAKVFLESLAPVEDAMQQLDFKKVELQYNENKQKRLSGPGSRYVDYDD
jgi:hypothetical protein